MALVDFMSEPDKAQSWELDLQNGRAGDTDPGERA